MTKQQKLAIIDAILALNAAIVGEPQKVFVTTRPKGAIRIGHAGPRTKWDYREYPDIDTAVVAALMSLERARATLK